MSSVRRYVSPRLLIPSKVALPTLEFCRGTSPSHAAHGPMIDAIPGLMLNGHPDLRLPNTLNVSFPGASGRSLLEKASHFVAASLGSACHSEHDAVSGVLAAMGFDAMRAAGAVRFSVGTMTTPGEVSLAANGLIEAWRAVARL